jgi:hypothetical protein
MEDKSSSTVPLNVAALATELQVTEQQVRHAIEEVEPDPSEIDVHLKGARVPTNSDPVGIGDGGQNG